MTGENIHIINGSVHLDHVVSAKEIHNDGGRILAGIEGVDLANTKTNLALTDMNLNCSKQDKSMSEFLKMGQKRKKELEQKENLTQNELNELKKWQQIDEELAIKADKRAREEIDKKD